MYFVFAFLSLAASSPLLPPLQYRPVTFGCARFETTSSPELGMGEKDAGTVSWVKHAMVTVNYLLKRQIRESYLVN